MKNALSIDLEDWFCAYNLRIGVQDWDKQELRVANSTRKILAMIDKQNVKATFFVLGWFAERVPDLVREVEQSGHEIATHGYSHQVLTSMTPEQFDADLRKALAATRACVQQPIRGFRAPSFTITNQTLWAFDILAKHGIAYDSSIFPISGHPDYGIGDAPLTVHTHGAVTEVPMSVAEIAGKRVPCSGGGYFRVFPYAATKFLMQQCNRQGRPVIFYLHPWEVDPGQPRRKLSWSKSFRHYFNLNQTLARLDHLLSDFEFVPIQEVIGL